MTPAVVNESVIDTSRVVVHTLLFTTTAEGRYILLEQIMSGLLCFCVAVVRTYGILEIAILWRAGNAFWITDVVEISFS